MMVNGHQYVVYGHLNRWRNLKAWRGKLRNVGLEVSTREYPQRAGTYWPDEHRIVIYHQAGLKGLVGMLKTCLHELAHAVEPNDGHDNKWQQTYSTAIHEVTGEYNGWGYNPYSRLDEKCYRSMLRWWRTSGAEAAAKKVLGL